MTCSLNLFFSMVSPVILGAQCCTSLIYLLHVCWMRTAIPRHILLFPVAAQVCSTFVFHDSSSCVLQVSLIVTQSQCLSLRPFNSWVSSWTPSSIVCDRVFVWTLVIAIVVFAVDVFYVGANVVCSRWLRLSCGADRYISICCYVLSFSSSTLLPSQSVAFGAHPGAVVVMSCRVVLLDRDGLDVGVFFSCF